MRPAYVGLALVIGLNFVLIYGVLFWHWNSFDLIFLYWFENLIIGVYTWIGFYFLCGSFLSKVFTSVFFNVHYGLFCFVHGVFIVSLFGKMVGLDTDDTVTTSTFIHVAQERHLYITIAGLFLLKLFFFSREFAEARTAVAITYLDEETSLSTHFDRTYL